MTWLPLQINSWTPLSACVHSDWIVVTGLPLLHSDWIVVTRLPLLHSDCNVVTAMPLLLSDCRTCEGAGG